MKPGDKVKFKDIPINHFFYSSGYIMQSRKSWEVYPTSCAPEVPMIQVYEVLEGDSQKLEKGDLTEDFFNHDFFYIGGNKLVIDQLVIKLRKENNYA